MKRKNGPFPAWPSEVLHCICYLSIFNIETTFNSRYPLVVSTGKACMVYVIQQRAKYHPSSGFRLKDLQLRKKLDDVTKCGEENK